MMRNGIKIQRRHVKSRQGGGNGRGSWEMEVYQGKEMTRNTKRKITLSSNSEDDNEENVKRTAK